ncbi:MAG: transposase [Frankiaceae bacterium]
MHAKGKDAIVATFSATDCGPCPARSLCTASGKNRRQLTVLPRGLAQAAARTAEQPIPFQAGYARRAGVEGTMHQAAAHGARRARYRSLSKTRLDPRLHGHRAQPATAGGILDWHAPGPAANQPPGTPRTRPRRIEPELATRIVQRA